MVVDSGVTGCKDRASQPITHHPLAGYPVESRVLYLDTRIQPGGMFPSSDVAAKGDRTIEQ